MHWTFNNLWTPLQTVCKISILWQLSSTSSIVMVSRCELLNPWNTKYCRLHQRVCKACQYCVNPRDEKVWINKNSIEMKIVFISFPKTQFTEIYYNHLRKHVTKWHPCHLNWEYSPKKAPTTQNPSAQYKKWRVFKSPLGKTCKVTTVTSVAGFLRVLSHWIYATAVHMYQNTWLQ